MYIESYAKINALKVYNAACDWLYQNNEKIKQKKADLIKKIIGTKKYYLFFGKTIKTISEAEKYLKGSYDWFETTDIMKVRHIEKLKDLAYVAVVENSEIFISSSDAAILKDYIK